MLPVRHTMAKHATLLKHAVLEAAKVRTVVSPLA